MKQSSCAWQWLSLLALWVQMVTCCSFRFWVAAFEPCVEQLHTRDRRKGVAVALVGHGENLEGTLRWRCFVLSVFVERLIERRSRRFAATPIHWRRLCLFGWHDVSDLELIASPQMERC
ncbi:unnamed protein product [Ostreobium quekettii]|uniref:Secreted protein n=1 Tax=Ostreobium quekettii TaxID=121088 RepID=A0A8S1IMJ4_9CHLO|nr:unnamed protein product [Ostreobium quekettii]